MSIFSNMYLRIRVVHDRTCLFNAGESARVFYSFVFKQPGDASHLKEGSDHDFLRELISEEKRKEHFTAVVITGISVEHIHYLRYGFNIWCTQLAYVIHVLIYTDQCFLILRHFCYCLMHLK